MSQYGGGSVKNPPWVRQTQQQMGMGVAQQIQGQSQILPQLGNASSSALQYSTQAQIYQQSQLGLQQSGMAAMQSLNSLGASQLSSAGGLAASIQSNAASLQQQQLYPQVGTVSYPTRSLITSYVGGANSHANSTQSSGSSQSNNSSGNSQRQRVFTGTVTKVQDNFGFVDDEVFFQTSCCMKGSNPQPGDKVLVEAVYNSNMPFKWNAIRIQVLPMDRSSDMPIAGRGRFSNVPPPSEDMLSGSGGGGGLGGGGGGGGSDFGNRRNNRNKRSRRSDEMDDFERKRRRDDRDRRSVERREEKVKEKEKEKEKERPKTPPPRKRSKTPRRSSRKTRVVPRYMVQIPKISLDMPSADVLEVKKRYTNMYIPSDFFISKFKWVEGFPPYRPLTLERPCAFHVMHKDVDPVIENDAVIDPPDLDYKYSAKVMLLSMIELDEIYKKCCSMAGDEKEGSEDKDFVHPTRLINFLVGLRGKNETMAIGGPWSPSLDGPNPDKDPTVLIKTAIRTCKALTGIDLSNCSQWYRFLEIYYHRAESVHKGKTVPARVETVVLYLPDVWSCQPTRLEWDGLHLNYKKQLDRLLNQEEELEPDDKDTSISEIQKKEPTHFSRLDPKVMKVTELREELEARTLSPKGLKSQLSARLSKVLKTEQEKEEEVSAKKNGGQNAGKAEKDEKDEDKKKQEEEEKKKLDEKEKQLVEKRHTLPEKCHILVHPSKVAKSGKFDCTVMSLSLLLDYRPEDSKEHSFEVSLFAELFNEMLMRDFGFCIYKAIVKAPEKPKEEKDDKGKNKDKKNDDKDKKDDDKKEEKKDEKITIEEDEASDEDEKKDKKDDKKKKDRVKLVTVDPYLMLAFVYFDQSHCGYIFDKDLEELLFTLGLNMSRAQVKKLVQKVVTKDSLHYRKLTDKPKDDTAKNGSWDVTELMNLSLGNKSLFPVFNEGTSPTKQTKKGGSGSKEDSELPAGFVMFNGSLLDINRLQAQYNRSEESRQKTEKALEKLRSEHSQLKDTNSRNNSTIKKLNADLSDFKERLVNTNTELCSVDSKTKLYYSTMLEIFEKLNPLVAPKPNTKEDANDDVEMEDAASVNTSSKQSGRSNTKQKSNVSNSPASKKIVSKVAKTETVEENKAEITSKQQEEQSQTVESKDEKKSEGKEEKKSEEKDKSLESEKSSDDQPSKQNITNETKKNASENSTKDNSISVEKKDEVKEEKVEKDDKKPTS